MADLDIQDLQRSLDELQQTINGLNGAAKSGQQQFEDMFANKKVGKGLTDLLNGLGTAVSKLTSSIYKGEASAKTYADGLETAADGASKALSRFGLAGQAAGVALQLFTKYIGAAANQSDKLFKSFQDMQRSGANTAGGLKDVFRQMQNFGYGIDELDKMTALIANNSQALALFRGNVAKGAEALGEVSRGIIRSDLLEQFMRMGMTVDEINEATAGYIAIQTQTGRVQKMTTDQITKSVAEYIKETDAITRLTGQSRQEQEAASKKAYAIEQFRFKVNEMMASGDERQIKQAEELDKAFRMINSQSPKLAAGFASLVTGVVAPGDGLSAALLSNGEALSIATSENMDAAAMVDRFGKAMRGSALPGLARFGQFSKITGVAYDEFDQFQKFVGSDLTERFKQFEGSTEAGVDAQVGLKISTMNARDALQSFVNLGVNTATRALQVLAGGTAAAAGTLPGEKPTPAGGGGGGGGGGGAVGATYGSAGRGSLGSSLAATGAGAAAGALFGSIGGPVGTILGGLAGGIAGAMGYDMFARSGSGKPGSEQKILDFLGKYESNGNYDVMVGGANQGLTKMTVGEVMQLQNQLAASGKGTAAGKYQIIQKTLAGLISQGVASPTDMFDSATQDKLGRALLDRRGYSAYKEGKITADQFADNLAKEWAALPTASGRSYYDGVGNNKALVSRADLMTAIQAETGGIFSGPRSGYRAVLHGTEAVVPLPDGKTIPVQMPELTASMSDQVSMMGVQISKLDELISVMRTQNTISEKILRSANS